MAKDSHADVTFDRILASGRTSPLPCDDRQVSLRPEAEPFAASGGPVGAVLCHGLTGMPGSLRDWGEGLAAAGLTVRVPRLPGHGTQWKDANGTTWQDWYDELQRAFDDVRSRCERT